MNQTKRRATYQYGTLALEPRRRGPDVWVYRYFEVEADRKRRRKTIVGTLERYPNLAAAERGCEHLRLSANQETVNLECPTMGGLIDRYIEQVLRPCIDVPLGGVQDSASPISFQCAKSYRSTLNRWVRPRWESYRLSDFNKPAVRATIEEWLHSLWRSPKNVNGLAPKTVRSIWNVMKLAFKFAVKWGYLNENPMGEKRVELPRGSTKRQKQPVQLTAAQFFLLLTRLGPCEKVAVAFAGWLGPRISEAFGLKWQDLDLRPGRGLISPRLRPGSHHAAQDRGVTHESAYARKRCWSCCASGAPSAIHRAPDDWVFASPYTKGKRPFWPAQLLKAHIKPIALAAGLPNIGWHSFRHTVSAWGKEAGLELEEVKTLLRHENLATTSEVYGDLGMEAKRRIQQQLVNFVKQQATRIQ